ncbi:MAG: N-glycosylase/DNA lyase [Nanobdellota archaeon]
MDKKYFPVIEEINRLKKESCSLVKKRIEEFNTINSKSNICWFRELVFCILAANTSSRMASKVTESIDIYDFLNLKIENLKEKMHSLSCRFYNKRAEYIVAAREYYNIKDLLSSFPNNFEKRDFLAENIKGIGYKEASHFLRNTGHFDLAILDKHVRNFLFDKNLISFKLKEGSLSKRSYLMIEEVLLEIADELGITQGELDFYIWYSKTGEVLK